MKAFTLAISMLAVAGCASTAVTPISRNQVIISTSAAPACGRSGSIKVATALAAVETIRRGHERFIIDGVRSENNVTVAQMPALGSSTSYQFNTYGNQTTGTAYTNYRGGGPIAIGSNDADISVVMLSRGDAGFSDGVDAKQFLGADWQKIVDDGVKTCL